MTDWVYVNSETGYAQDFLLINHSTNETIDPTGGTLRMYIQSADFQTDFPADGNGVAMAPVAVEGGVAARLNVEQSNMPQEAGMYYAQIKLEQVSRIRSFLINLRVIRRLGNE